MRSVVVMLALASLGGGVAAATQPSSARHGRGTLPTGAAALQPPASQAATPNIVFVLTDDLSMDLLPYMPRVQSLQRRGLTFNDYFVSDSLCCPSRSSIFTGNLPHDTGVFDNVGPHGGFHVFHSRGEELSTFAVALQRAGYRTALMGKYLNGYLSGPGAPADVAPSYVPPGWTEWAVGGQSPYREFDYTLNENGTLHQYGHAPADYLTDVLAGKGAAFIHRSAAAGTPFFLELSTFAPHSPYVPAPRYADAFPGLKAPRPPNFGTLPTHAPSWLAGRAPLSGPQLHKINRVFRRRVQSVQAVDDMLGRLQGALAANGVADNTYVVFSSDNGLHTGAYRLMPGKMTAFDTDIHVPLVVSGPGVPAGASTDAMSENIDLAKTFAAIGGTTLPGDGHSLMTLLRGQPPANWRNAILVEHHGPDLHANDPDYQQSASGSPRTYAAMRTHRFLYVEYDNGETEFYDLRSDPFELHNLARGLSAAERALLHAELAAIKNCHDGPSCWSATHVDRVTPSLARLHHQPGR